MSFTKDINKLWDIMFAPGKTSKKPMKVGEVLRLYYTLSIVPFVLYIVFGVLLSAYFGSSAANYLPTISAGGLTTSLSLYIISSAILLFFVIVPIGIAIDTAIYQLIGRFFLNAWKGDYHKTFTALTYSVLPVMFFYWLLLLPVLNGLYLIIFPIWSIVILIISLSVQQKLTRLNAALVTIVTGVLTSLFVVLVATSVLAFVGTILTSLAGVYLPGVPLGSSACGALPFLCTHSMAVP